MNNHDDEIDYLEREKIKYKEFLKNDAIKLVKNEVYLQEASTWAKSHYKIIFVDDVVALGKKVFCGIYNSNTKNCNSYELFKVETGEKYLDSRLEYRLKKIEL